MAQQLQSSRQSSRSGIAANPNLSSSGGGGAANQQYYTTVIGNNSSSNNNGGLTDRAEEPKHGIGLGLKLQPGVGYAVVSVCPASSADRASINVGDILVAADGKTVHQGLKPLDILGPKRSVAVLQFDNGRVVEVVRGGPALDSRGLRQDGLLGLSVSRVQGRVLVAHVASNSPAQREGLQMGDCILTMNGLPCDPSRLTSRGAVGSKVVLSVQRHSHAAPKTVSLTRVAVGTGWKQHSSTPRGDSGLDTDRDEKNRIRQSKFATFVPRSPSKSDRPRSGQGERTLPTKTDSGFGSSGGEGRERSERHSSSRGGSGSRTIDNMHGTIETLQAEIAHLRARLLPLEQLETRVEEIKRTTEDLAHNTSAAAAKKPVVDDDDGSELDALKAKVEQNSTAVDEATTAIKMMNLGIHAAINGISNELDMLFEHCKIKRPPRGPPPSEGDKGGLRGKGPSMPPPASHGKGRKPGASPLSSLTEGTTLSPQSMRVHSNNPTAPGGLAVLGNLPRPKTAPSARASAHEV